MFAIGFGAPQCYRGSPAQGAPQKTFTQQSKDLSVAAVPVRASTGTQMATLCLVQPSDNSASTGGNNLSSVVAAYSTVLSD
jgi:hypothetical protein